MQCACAVLSSAACPALLYVPHYLTNGTVFEKGVLNIESVYLFSLQLFSETFLMLRRSVRYMKKKM